MIIGPTKYLFETLRVGEVKRYPHGALDPKIHENRIHGYVSRFRREGYKIVVNKAADGVTVTVLERPEEYV